MAHDRRLKRDRPVRPAHRLAFPFFADATIFEQDWWLSAASNGTVHYVKTTWDSRLVGQMPFYLKRRWGLTSIISPPYTRTISPRFDLPPSKEGRRRINQVRVLEDLLGQLPRHDRFEMTLPPDLDLVYPFVRLGYTAATNYTFRVEAGNDSDAILAGMDQKVRNMIRKGLGQFRPQLHGDIDRFMRLAEDKSGGKTDRHDFEALRRIWSECNVRQQGQILTLAGANDEDVASTILVWDARALYFWVTTRNPLIAGNSATCLMIWEALKLALGMGLAFDVDSYGSAASAEFVSRFGFTPEIRPVINQGGAVWKLLFLLRNTFSSREDLYYRC